MSSDPGSPSSKEDESQSAHPKRASYIETPGADDEFARKLQSRQHRLEHAEASQGEVQPNQPKDTNGMANVNSGLRQNILWYIEMYF